MQRKLSVLCLALSLFCITTKSHAQKGKSEIALGYGYWSIYTLVNGVPFSNSSGSPVITYRYYLTRDVTLGMGLCYENIAGVTGRINGSFVSFCPELTVSYMDTRKAPIRIRLYGAASLGVSVFSDGDVTPGQADRSGLKPWGFQATPFGIRIGRQIAYFAELGVGYKGLFHTGLAVRFPKSLRTREKPIEY
jgi:hypothetical protein